MQVLPIGKFVSAVTVIWGAILMTTPGCTSFAGIATNRFFLGLTEATVNPAFVMIMSIWYTSAEQPLRLGSYYCTNGLATMFGGLIGYAVGHITTGLPQWMYVFLIFGALSFAWGIVSFILLPDIPATAPFLSQRERVIAIDRVSRNKGGVKNHHFRGYQAVQCARDPKTWILFVMAVGAQIPNSALTSFTSIIIDSFGFDTLGTQYLQIPGGAVQFLALIIGGWVCTRWPQRRCITMIVANTICILGAGLLVGLPDSNKVSSSSGLPPVDIVNVVTDLRLIWYTVGPIGSALVVLLPGLGLQHVVDDGFVECCGFDQEAADWCRAVHRLLRRQHHRPADFHFYRSS